IMRGLLHQDGEIGDRSTRAARLLVDGHPEDPEFGQLIPVRAPEAGLVVPHCCNRTYRCSPSAHRLLNGFMLVSGGDGHSTYRLSGVTPTPRTCSNILAGRKSSDAFVHRIERVRPTDRAGPARVAPRESTRAAHT